MKNLLGTFIEKIVKAEGKKFLDMEFVQPDTPWKEILRPDLVRSLYVHIPFCKVLCPYCSFNRYPYQDPLALSYFEALKGELKQLHEIGLRFDRLYIGGGTPTVNIHALASLVEEMKQLFPIGQISMETNPSDLTEENIAILQQLGVKRLSVGVQTFRDSLLQEIGRTSHTGKSAIEAIQRAHDCFETLNIDLMFNFPTQTQENVLEDIRIIQSLPVNQVTYYPLMPSPHRKTKLEQAFRKVSTEREFALYQFILDKMLPDYHLSTAWCFSKGDRIIDEYIVEDTDYLGAGAGAVSFVDGHFFVNTFSPENYIDKIAHGVRPTVLHKKSTLLEEARYYMLTRLFGMKMPVEEYYQKYGRTLWKELTLLRLSGLTEIRNGYIQPNRKGLYYVSLMMKQFFSSLNWLREYCMENRI